MNTLEARRAAEIRRRRARWMPRLAAELLPEEIHEQVNANTAPLRQHSMPTQIKKSGRRVA